VRRRFDCLPEASAPAVPAEKAKREAAGLNPEPFLLKACGQRFFNTPPPGLKKLMGDQEHIGENRRACIQAFSPAVRDIFERFEFHPPIDSPAKAGRPSLVTGKCAPLDLHPEVVSNARMGPVFEERIRKFAGLSNKTAGEPFTPREVIRQMVHRLFIKDDGPLTRPGVVRSLYDPSAGTGGMLSIAGEYPAEINPDTRLVLYGKKLNPVPDASLRDTENVPLSEDVDACFPLEALPHAPDAWIDHDKTKVSYEIPFNRHFYVFQPPRPLAEIDAELKTVTDSILKLIGGLSA
jgi:type I restriction enzyme M protein